MAYAIRRKDPDGSDEVIAYVDDARDIGTAIDEDRRKIDWEPVYHVDKE